MVAPGEGRGGEVVQGLDSWELHENQIPECVCSAQKIRAISVREDLDLAPAG